MGLAMTHGHLLRQLSCQTQPQKPCILVQEHPLLMEQSSETPNTNVIKQEQSCFSIVTNTQEGIQAKTRKLFYEINSEN